MYLLITFKTGMLGHSFITHRDAFILGADSGVIAFPGDGGLRVTTGRHAL